MDDIPIELWKASGEEGVYIIIVENVQANNYWQNGNGQNIGAGRYSIHCLRKKTWRSAKFCWISSKAESSYNITERWQKNRLVVWKETELENINIRINIEKCREQNMLLHMCFIDYAKAFDRVSQMKLLDAMEQMGFPVHIIQLVKNLYKEQE